MSQGHGAFYASAVAASCAADKGIPYLVGFSHMLFGNSRFSMKLQ